MLLLLQQQQPQKLFLLTLLFLWSRSTMTNDVAAFLVPSQVRVSPSSSHKGITGRDEDERIKRTSCTKEYRSDGRHINGNGNDVATCSTTTATAIHMLVPSQAMPRGGGSARFQYSSNGNTSRNRSRFNANVERVAASVASDDNSSSSLNVSTEGQSSGGGVSIENNNKKKKKRRKPQKKKHRASGNIPDVHWRAIPLDHLRHHPKFEALPHPDTLRQMSSLEDVRLFRQDSWQWDALHSGRCTTSQATAALGLLEPIAGSVLGIPRSLQKGSVSAYHRLSKPALRSLEDMQVLCTGEGNSPPELENLDYPVWDSDTTTRYRETRKFAALYLPRLRKTDLDNRRQLMKNFYLGDNSRWLARMQWGNAQEPTSILTALNYFSNTVPGTVIREVGMCGAGLDLNSTNDGDSGLIIGATPDAVIHYPNGTLEALEVKNHCPFVPLYWGSRQKAANAGKDLFRIREASVQMDVPPAYVPQLMLEMLSLGPECKSAIMVRQTATRGAVILRLHRDDDWIEEMLHWLNQFMYNFVNEEVPPPRNVFWANDDYSGGERYRNFVNRTKEISESAELVATVPHSEIQRVVSTNKFQIPLFLD